MTCEKLKIKTMKNEIEKKKKKKKTEKNIERNEEAR